MSDRGFEYSKMVNFMTDMHNALESYSRDEYENALHLALNAIDNALCVYLSIVNDYPYTERQYNWVRDMRNMVDKEQLKIQMDFENNE